MLFRALTLQNFQAHESLSIIFTPGITTIVGSTDSGKSAILRALRWAALNDFLGDSFIKEGEDEAVVSVTVRHAQEDHTVVRQRSTSQNTYALDEKVYKSFGQSVPADIATLLTVSPINFQGQHDSPFWFCEGGAELSRQLNAIVDLSVMDKALSSVNLRVHRAQERESLLQEALVAATDAHATAKQRKSRIEEFERLEKADAACTAAKTKADQLWQILKRLDSLQVDFLQQAATSVEKVFKLCKQARTAQERQDRLSAIVAGLEKNARVKEPPSIQPLQAALQQAKKMATNVQSLAALIKALQTQEAVVSNCAAEAIETEQRVHRRLRGNICPLCQQTIQ